TTSTSITPNRRCFGPQQHAAPKHRQGFNMMPHKSPTHDDHDTSDRASDLHVQDLRRYSPPFSVICLRGNHVASIYEMFDVYQALTMASNTPSMFSYTVALGEQILFSSTAT